MVSWYHGGDSAQEQAPEMVTEIMGPDILVVGAGPAGLASATAAAQSGAGVVLTDGASWAGGRLALQTQPLQGPKSIFGALSGVDFCRRLIDEASTAGVDIRLGARVVTIDRSSDGAFVAALAGGKAKLRVRSVVVATGSNEPRFDFPGSDLPGVMLSGDAQEMLNIHGRLPGQRIAMVGSDNAGLLISANLMDAGAVIIAVVEEASEVVGRHINWQPLQARGVQFLTSAKVLTASGAGRLELMTLRDAASGVRQLDIDVMCLAGPRIPSIEVVLPTGIAVGEHDALGGLVPVHSRRMGTSIPGLYVCGDSSGVENGAAALESGRIAGLSAARDLGYQHPRARELLARAGGRLGYLRRGRRGGLRRLAKNALAAEQRGLSHS